MRDDLADQLGGAERITAAQRILIERVAVDVLRLELFDAEMTAGTFSAHDARVAHALRNSVRLALRDLGLKQAQAKPSPAEHLALYTAGRTAADILAEREAAA